MAILKLKQFNVFTNINRYQIKIRYKKGKCGVTRPETETKLKVKALIKQITQCFEDKLVVSLSEVV